MKKTPDIINTMRTAKAMFAPTNPHIEYDPHDPEAVGVSRREGAVSLWSECQVGSWAKGARVEIGLYLDTRTHTAIYKVEAHFSSPGALTPVELVAHADLAQHVATAACYVEAYLRDQFRTGLVSPTDLEELLAWCQLENANA